uniref:DUF695 domain-containing protein n=1 Tax=Steinernema glaseri TaxID=37863 RepID=A0A1I8AAU3_9BILA
MKPLLEMTPEELQWIYYTFEPVVLPDGTTGEVLMRHYCTPEMIDRITAQMNSSANEPVPPVDSYEDWGDLEAFNDLFSDADLAEWEAEEQAAAAA